MKQFGFFSSFIKWNFTKFLCDKEGKPVKRYSPGTDFKVSKYYENVLRYHGPRHGKTCFKHNMQRKAQIRVRVVDSAPELIIPNASRDALPMFAIVSVSFGDIAIL